MECFKIRIFATFCAIVRHNKQITTNNEKKNQTQTDVAQNDQFTLHKSLLTNIGNVSSTNKFCIVSQRLVTYTHTQKKNKFEKYKNNTD